MDKSHWIEASIDSLAPPANWTPDEAAAWGRLTCGAGSRPVTASQAVYKKHLPFPRWAIGLAAAALLAIAVFVNANARALAQQCWQCIAASGLELALHTNVAAGIITLQSRVIAPDFSLPAADGTSIRLSDFKGKVVLLDFWATWCGGCKIEIPWYEQFSKAYKHDGLVVLGVSTDDGGWKVVKPFMLQKKIDYPIVLGNDRIIALYGIKSMPVTLLIDRAGKIAATHIGVVDRRSFEQHIRLLLKEKPLRPL